MNVWRNLPHQQGPTRWEAESGDTLYLVDRDGDAYGSFVAEAVWVEPSAEVRRLQGTP